MVHWCIVTFNHLCALTEDSSQWFFRTICAFLCVFVFVSFQFVYEHFGLEKWHRSNWLTSFHLLGHTQIHVLLIIIVITSLKWWPLQQKQAQWKAIKLLLRLITDTLISWEFRMQKHQLVIYGLRFVPIQLLLS